MKEIDIQQLLTLVMQNAGEYAKLNQNMERIARVLEAVENNEIDIIGRNKGLYQQLKDFMESLKDREGKTDLSLAEIFRAIREVKDSVGNINFSGNGISKEAIELIFKEQVDERLVTEKDKTSKLKDRWIRVLLIVAVVLLIVILMMIGFDVAGVFDVTRGIV